MALSKFIFYLGAAVALSKHSSELSAIFLLT